MMSAYVSSSFNNNYRSTQHAQATQVRDTSDKERTDVRGIHEDEQGNLLTRPVNHVRRTSFKEVLKDNHRICSLSWTKWDTRGFHDDHTTTTFWTKWESSKV